jgi:hypothetical protein
MRSQLRVEDLFNSPVPRRIAFGGKEDEQEAGGEGNGG